MTDDGRAHGLADPGFDTDLHQVGAGTPTGELLRRYWHPVARSKAAI